MQLLLLSQFFCRCLRVVPGWVGGLDEQAYGGFDERAYGGLGERAYRGLGGRASDSGYALQKVFGKHARTAFCSVLRLTTRAFPKIFHRTPAPPKPSSGVGMLLNTKTGHATRQTRHAARTALPTHFGDFQLPNTALASVEYAQAAIKCIVNASKKQRRKATPSGLAAFGIQKRANQHCQATGEWVCDEKFWGRRALTMVERQKTPFARVFQKLFAAHTPSAALTSKASDFPPKAALAHHLGTFPPGAAPRHQINRTAAL